MTNVIATEYLAPKWQAYVTPRSRYFNFSNGVMVGSLWELKQALLQIPEDIVISHIRESKHDIADWVEHVVGDVDLSNELRRYNHRWGLVVALERHMMRTLFLPHYVANRWLAKVELPFMFESGEKANSLEDLANLLLKIKDEVVDFHCQRNPNDIAVWIADAIGDYELADLVAETNSRGKIQQLIADHLQMLHEAILEC